MIADTDRARPSTPAGARLRLSPAVRGWLVAVLVYFTAVFHRTSLGVAGLQASHRFGITPAQLSVFVLLQLGVYAAMQIPTGVLVDRFGSRRLLTAAAAIMATAQLLFAVAPSYSMALFARALLGCGDALTFVSVLRFAANNFRPRHYPMIVAVTAMLGSIGNVVATVPLTIALRDAGWTPTFAGAALVSAVAAAAVWLLMPESFPSVQHRRSVPELRESSVRVVRRVRSAWQTPGTRLGFWVHFSAMSTATVFTVLWGVPYLVSQGYSQTAASGLLLASVIVATLGGPAVGAFIGRWPGARVPFALIVCGSTILCWLALLGLGGGHPTSANVLAVVAIMSLGAPTSAIGFALARDYNRPSMVGTATGVVNVGGFLAAIIGSALVGGALDVLGSSGAEQFRIAFLIVIAVQIVGTVQVVRWWLRARASNLRAQQLGEPVPVHVTQRRWDLAVDR